MKTVNPLRDTVTACGNILRGIVEVQGQAFAVESDGTNWLNLIDAEGRCECCKIDSDRDVIAESGEYVTEAWTSGDWEQLTAMVK